MGEEEREALEYFKDKIKNKLPLYEETYVDGKLYRRDILQLETNFTEEQANKTQVILKLISKLLQENEKLRDIKNKAIGHINCCRSDEGILSKDEIRYLLEILEEGDIE